MKLHEIIPGHLFQRGRADHIDRDVKLAVLAENDITYVITLWKADLDLAVAPTLKYVAYPIPDGATLAPAKLGMLQMLATGAAWHINRTGEAVLSQCHAGRNRSGLLSALIIRELNGCSGGAALEAVRKARPNAIANPFFENWLRRLE